jgi:hypothetical protein
MSRRLFPYFVVYSLPTCFLPSPSQILLGTLYFSIFILAWILPTVFLLPYFLIIEKQSFFSSIRLGLRVVYKNFVQLVLLGIVIFLVLFYFLILSGSSSRFLVDSFMPFFKDHSSKLHFWELIDILIIVFIYNFFSVFLMIFIFHQYPNKWQKKIFPTPIENKS